MNDAAGRMAYEEAAVCRDRIAALSKVREKQYVSDGPGRDTDIIACGRAAGITCVNLTMVRGGRHLGDKNFFPRNAEDTEEEQVLEAFILQHYLQHGVPPQLVVGAPVPVAALEQVLSEQAGRKVQITANPGGARKIWLDMAKKNACLGAGQALGLQATQEARLSALQQALELPETTQRIECFDISHTMGEATVASCVVYDKSAMQKSEYRRYNITGVAAGDDYGAMRDVLSRRYRKIVSGEGKVPDLVLIDGGKGQLGVAREVFAELGLNDVALVAVAKGEERKPGLEQLLIPGRDAGVAAAEGTCGVAPDPANPRRSAPVRDRRPPRAPRQSARELAAGGDFRRRGKAPAAAAGAFRRSARPAVGERRRSGASRGHQPRAGRENLSRVALMPFNLPILLTWLRIVLIPLFVGIFYFHKSWVSAPDQNLVATVIFTAAAITDWLDGWLARKLDQTSAFGAFLDPVADKLMVAAALIVLVQLERVDAIIALIIIGREITISALREWMANIGEAKSVAVSFLGKLKTVSQMIAIPLLLYHDPHRRLRSAARRHLADLSCGAADAGIDGLLPENGPAAGLEKELSTPCLEWGAYSIIRLHSRGSSSVGRAQPCQG